ncbi:TetR/AcrR family transcriptional regulator [Comamonas sp. NoAH]|uniref:TetR/AcrR family transcriptional regulator n=1 Tax=Comamonas halotolerans TaxID=3041496 RepID=UPI0024E0E9BA|nr:TetR/AcrR family transcriptional regulator [Comamonas sp. NoAH]
MKGPEQSVTRGRPRTITRERIADAGIEAGLPNITFTGIAAALGVSHMALYKHVPNLEELKRLVAEEIFSRWQIPVPGGNNGEELRTYLSVFSLSVREFVKSYPGVTPYVLRRLAATPSMLAKIDGHQRHIAQTYGISKEQARELLATVAFHTLAASDTVYSVAGQEPEDEKIRAAEEAEMEAELDQGIQTLIVGALTMMQDAVRSVKPDSSRNSSASSETQAREWAASIAQIDQWLAEMTALMLAKQPFVLIYERQPESDELHHADVSKKILLWMKAHRKAFKTYCRGMVLMSKDAKDRPALQAELGQLEKTYLVPARVAITNAEAQAHVKELSAIQVMMTAQLLAASCRTYDEYDGHTQSSGSG